MGPGGFGPGFFVPNENVKPKLPDKPKKIKDIPKFLYEIVSKFLFRLFYIFSLVWETRPWILFLMIFMTIFNGITPIISALISSRLLNKLSEAYFSFTENGIYMFSDVMFWLIFSFVFAFFTSLIGQVNSILNRISGELVVNHTKLKIMTKAKEVDLASFDKPEFYEKLENASREAGGRPIQVLNANFSIISTIISMISFIIIIWNVNPIAPLIVIAMSIPSAIINFVYRRKNFSYMRHRSKDRRQLTYYSDLLTDKDLVKEVRIFGLSDLFIGRYKNVFDKYFKGLKKLFVNEGVWHIILTFVTLSAKCFLFLLIARGLAEGKYQIGDYSLYTGALESISSGIGTLISTSATIYEGTLFIDNLIMFMNEKKTIKPSVSAPRHVNHHTGHKIEFKNVSFRYPGTQKDVLKDVNITLEPGDTAVLVGLNGAGKTTLIKLLTRLYDPTEGAIFLDGFDIKEYDVEDLYSMYGTIFQDFGKYAVTVSENISFGDIHKETDAEAIRRSAIQSSADGFIENLPDKYNTPLMRYFESNGIELSIGQWQKLSIARAFYSDSDVLILDEPTASLDAIAEQEVFNQFDNLRKDKTTIFVSHRLSSATVANKIFVLSDGKIIEQGNHSELMKAKGEYYRLFSTQAKRYITPPEEDEGTKNELPPHVLHELSKAAETGNYFDGDLEHGRPPHPHRPEHPRPNMTHDKNHSDTQSYPDTSNRI